MKPLSRTDNRLITPHLDVWNDLITKTSPDTILTRNELSNLIASGYEEGPYRDQFVGALIRYSISRGDLVKIGTEHFVRIGVSRESIIALSQHVALAGLFVEEESPGTFLGYEDLHWADGKKERHYSMFARNVGDTTRWAIFSVPIIVNLEEVTENPMWDDRTRGFIAKRLEWILVM